MNRFARAISLARPWGELVLRHGKTTENRLWKTTYRGPLIIHSSQTFDYEALALCRYRNIDPARVGLDADLPTGYIGVVDLADIHAGPDAYALPEEPCGCEWGFEGQWHWVLSDPRPFSSALPGKGRLGIFDPPTVVVDHARLIGAL